MGAHRCFGARRRACAAEWLGCRGRSCGPQAKSARFGKYREGRMTEGFGRRDFLKGAVAGSVAATTAAPTVAEAQPQPAALPAAADAAPPGYAFLNLDEAAFVEALVDHMVPAD